MSLSTTTDASAYDGSRYPKRKRNIVSYADQDISSDEESDQEDQPARKKSRSAPKSRPQKPFPFMLLPPEIRNKIYEEALFDPEGLYIRSSQGRYRRKAMQCSQSECIPQYRSSTLRRMRRCQHILNNNTQTEGKDATDAGKHQLVPALLATCKAIYAEAAQILYSQPITVSDTYALQSFLIEIGPRSVKLLEDLAIAGWCISRSHKAINLPAFALLRDATSLRYLYICNPVRSHYYRWHRRHQQLDDNAAKLAQGVHVAGQMYRAMFPFLEALVRARGEDALGEIIRVEIGTAWSNSRDSDFAPGDRGYQAMLDEIHRLLGKHA
ncbi:hypothetical protein BX600DRAFT_503400 [Xylariales sp. PMI_506]|nr:hypothetical protein BX600DRAFT_503400 [Xylariales sp. PMI_506]